MDYKIVCEPNDDLPQHIDINLLRSAEAAKDTAAKEASAAAKLSQQEKKTGTFGVPDTVSYDILPLFHQPKEQLMRHLSLQHNEYMRLKFNKFLDNPANSWVNVVLYRDLHVIQPPPRRLKLNGRFYDADNKLAPAPFIPDPRQ